MAVLYWRRTQKAVIAGALCLSGTLIQAAEPHAAAPQVSAPQIAETPDAATLQLEAVVITETPIPDQYDNQSISETLKNGLPLMDSAISVQQVPATTLQDQQADSLQDALKNVSGVNPTYYLGGAYERFVVRGFTQSLGGYRNGVLQPFTHFHRASTERVEVLKGPAGMEYGVSDPGGIINVVTRKPGVEDELQLEQVVATDDQYTTLLSANKALSDQVAVRLDASYVKAHGFREVADTEATFVAPSVSFALNDDTKVRLSFESDTRNSVYDQGLLALGEGFIDVSREKSFGQKGLIDDYETRAYEVVVEHRLNQQWDSQIGYSYFSTDNYFRSVYAYGDLQPGDTEADRYAWFGPEDMDSYTAFATLRGGFNTGSVRHQLVAGVQQFGLHLDAAASETVVDTINIYDFNYTNSNFDPQLYESEPFGFISVQRDTTNHFFVQDNLYLGDHWVVSLGVAYDDIERKLETAYYSPTEYYARQDDDVSPRAGVVYKVNAGLSLFAGYSMSFGPAFEYEPGALNDPEQAQQIEMGLKQQSDDGKSLLTISLFELEKSNITVPGALPNTTESVGKARSRGLELDWLGELAPGVSLIASYAYTETKVLQGADDSTGNWLPNAPQHQASGWLRYDVAGLDGLALGGGVNYVGKGYGDTDNSYFDEAYARWDLFAAYRFVAGSSDIEAQLNLQNITDENYYSMRARWTNMPAEPFAVAFSIRVLF